VNQNTGAIQLGARFANSGNVLQPGQYGKVRAVRVQRNARLIPQAAVNEQQGSHVVYVVGSDGKVAVRTVQVGDRTGTMWVIQDNMKPGERVIDPATALRADQKRVAGQLIESTTAQVRRDRYPVLSAAICVSLIVIFLVDSDLP
jgi:membrane fusion protein (multidrug efflux system)